MDFGLGVGFRMIIVVVVAEGGRVGDLGFGGKDKVLGGKQVRKDEQMGHDHGSLGAAFSTMVEQCMVYNLNVEGKLFDVFRSCHLTVKTKNDQQYNTPTY